MTYHLKALLVALFALPFTGTTQTTALITGQDSVCRNSQHTYTISPSSDIFYQWEVSVHGSLVTTTGSQVSVSWHGAGAASLVVKGYDTAAQLVEEGTLPVYVSPPPEPLITWNSQIGCQVANPHINDTPDSLNVDIRDGNCVRVCEWSTVTYKTDHVTGSDTLDWQVSGGAIVSAAGDSCIVIWDTAGFGSLGVAVTTPNGCTAFRQICIEIMAAPKAKFSMLNELSGIYDSLSCTPGPIYFIDQSEENGSPIVSWYWDFGNSTSNVQNPYHPNTDGLGDVTLTVTNECNCSSSVTRTLDTYPSAGMTVDCITPVCENGSARYFYNGCPVVYAVGGTIMSGEDQGLSVLWDQGIDSTGFGYLIFDPECIPNCDNPVMARVPVIQQEGYIQGPRVVCPGGKQYRFQLPQWPATVFKWSIESATGASLLPTDQPNEYLLQTDQPGTVTINVVYKNTLLGCGGVATVEVDVQEPIVINGPSTLCANNAAVYTAYDTASNPVSGDWVLRGPGGYTQTNTGTTVNAAFPTSGLYTLSFTNSAYCSPDPLNITVPIQPPIPDTLKGPDTVCLHTPYTFIVKNARADAIFHWAAEGGTFSGSSTGNEVNVVFTASSGPYRIKVWRERNRAPFCTSDTLVHTLYPPHISLAVNGPDTACSNTYQLYSAGYDLGETYEWSIFPATIGSAASGDGSPDVQVLWNQVSAAGYADLIVKMRKCGTEYMDTLKVWVTPAPSVSIIAPDSVCRDAQFALSLTGTPALTSWTAVNWDFGDGNGGSGPAPTHTYTTLNQSNTSYPVTVTVTGPNGCFANAAAQTAIIVKPAPVANITPPGPFELCDTTQINTELVATIQSGFGATDAVTWYRNGAVVSAGGAGNVSYTAVMTGLYHAVVANSNGCTSVTNIVHFRHECPEDTCILVPEPEVTISGGLTSCGTVELTAGYTSGGFNPAWTWPMQATSASTTTTTGSFTFDRAGNYPFTYSVFYDNGAGDTCRVSDQLYVIVPYIAGLKYNVTCGTTPGTYSVTLQDHSNYYPQTPITNWAFYIDGTPYQSGSQTSYTTSLPPGTYELELRITGGSYPECRAYATLELPALPVADFSFAPDAHPVCVGAPVSFTSLSTPTGLAHHWDFGDLAENLQQDPERVFELPTGGASNVTLTVTNIYGCSDDTFKAVSVVANTLGGGLTAIPTPPVCKGTLVNLSYEPDLGTTAPDVFYWQQDLDTFNITTTSSAYVSTSGGYWATITNHYGCTRSTYVTPVDFINIPDAVINGDTRYCQDEPFTLYGYAGPDIASYYWYRNGNLVAAGSHVPDLEEPGLNAGTYEYRLAISVTRPGGGFCTDTSAAFVVTVGSLPPDPMITYDMVDCQYYTLELEGTNSVPGHYTWSNGMSGSPVWVNQGGPYKLYFTDTNGCVATAETDIPKDPETYMWIFPAADCYEFCYTEDTIGILPGPVIPFEEWDWGIGSGGSGSGPVPSSVLQGISASGALYLDNGLCARTSGNMSITVYEPCHCEMKGCDEEVTSELDVKVCLDYIDVNYNQDSTCVNEGELYIIGDRYLTLTISSPDGIFIPSSFYSPTGGTFPFRFIPNAGFNGGPALIKYKAQLFDEWEDWHLCTRTDTFIFPYPLCTQPQLKPSGRPATVHPVNKKPRITPYSADGSSLQLAPNPASAHTRIIYKYAGNHTGSRRAIEVYDLTGRMIRQLTVPDMEGSIDLDLHYFTPALYMIVMKEDGRIMAQQKLHVMQ